MSACPHVARAGMALHEISRLRARPRTPAACYPVRSASSPPAS